MATARWANGQIAANDAATMTKLGDGLFARMDRVGSELFALTYGTLVAQMMRDIDDVDLVNERLFKKICC